MKSTVPHTIVYRTRLTYNSIQNEIDITGTPSSSKCMLLPHNPTHPPLGFCCTEKQSNEDVDKTGIYMYIPSNQQSNIMMTRYVAVSGFSYTHKPLCVVT